MKGKVVKKSSPAFAVGGSTKMHGKQAAGPQTAGVTAGKSGTGGKFAAGGSTGMHGKQVAGRATAGKTVK